MSLSGDSLAHELDRAAEALGERDWLRLAFHARRITDDADRLARQEAFVHQVRERRRVGAIANIEQGIEELLRRLRFADGAPPTLCDEIERWLARLDELRGVKG